MSARLALIGGEEFSAGFEDVPAGLLTELVTANGAVAIIGDDRKPRRFTAGERVTL